MLVNHLALALSKISPGRLGKMAIGVDTTNRKPRRSKGTPLYKFRNYISLGVLGVGVLIGSAFMFWPNLGVRRKIQEYIEKTSELDRYNAPLIEMLEPRTPSLIIKDSHERLMSGVDE